MLSPLIIDYAFRYYIDHPQTGVSLDHWENRRGDYVHGGYGVLEPGGYVRTVHYEVEGNSGFRTVIKTTAPEEFLEKFLNKIQEKFPEESVEDFLDKFIAEFLEEFLEEFRETFPEDFLDEPVEEFLKLF
ncbi:hypothetical protein RP20_CCG001689 [Aedes albopictus]|nr:hypothetical protein RP20_CCG001689 [Aedes albopictus]